MANQSQTISFVQLKPLLKFHIQCDQVPFLVGQPGIGKSAVLKHLADDFNTKLFVLSVNQLGTREDLTGARSIKDEKTNTYRQVFFPHAIIQDAIDYAKSHPEETPFLFLDEVNRTSSDVTSAIMALITERRIGTTPLPSNLRLVAAGNDDGNVATMDMASNSRMQIYHVQPDVASFINAQPNLNFYIKQLLTQNPNLLVEIPNQDLMLDDNSDEDDDDDNNASSIDIMDEDSMIQITVPRTLTYMSDFLNNAKLDGQKLPDNLDDIYNATDVNASPLYFAIQATLGTTQAADKLFENIVDSINTLTMANQSNANQNYMNVNVPKANDRILTAMYHDVNSDDDVDALFSDDSFNAKDFVKTYLTLIQPKNYQKVAYQTAMNRYYSNLAAMIQGNLELQKQSSQVFSELLQADLVAKGVLDTLQNENDEYATRLNAIVDAINF